MTDDDIESRAQDYEHRLATASSTEGIIGALVKGAERSKRFIMWLAISLAFDILLSIFLGGLAVVAYRNATKIEVQARVACTQSAQNSVVINSFLDLLIVNTQISTALTPAEKAERVTGYRKLIIKIPDCK